MDQAEFQLRWLTDRKKPCVILQNGESNTHWIVRVPVNGDWSHTYEIATPRENVAELPSEYDGPRELELSGLLRLAFPAQVNLV